MNALTRSSLARAAWLLLPVLATAATASADPWRVVVKGQGAALGETPVVVELKSTIPPGDYTLVPAESGKARPAHVFRDGGKTFLGIVLDHVAAAPKAEVYSLQRETKSELSSAGVELRSSGSNVEVLVGGKPFTTYITDDGPKPYYFPVIGPTGASFTRAYPMKNVEGEDRDHPHQRSMFFTHGNVNGFDFWASDPKNPPKPNYGSIKETAVKTLAAGQAVGVIHTTDDWLGPDGKKVCEDERVVRFYDTRAGRVFDFDVVVKATAGPVTFGDTKEGMFGLRVASSMDVKNKKGGKITNAEGLTDEAAWGKASPWVDYTGPVEGKQVGVAILNHPSSFRYPTTWHVRTYGLFAANPFGWHDFGMKQAGDYTIPEGQSIAFRYRVVLHAGPADVAKLMEAYATPPAIEVASE